MKLNALWATRHCADRSSHRSGEPRSSCFALRFSFLLALSLLSTQLLHAKQPQLVFRDSTPATDDITFNIPLPPEESGGPAVSQSAQMADLSDKSYVLAIGSDYSFPPNDNKEFFKAYLRTPDQNNWLAYSVTAIIPAAFFDKELIVSVTVDGVQTPVTGKVSIKFHNNSITPFSVDPTNTGELDFTRTDAPTVLLKNNGKSFPVNITHVQILHSRCPNCWKAGYPAGPVSLLPSRSEELSIPLKANTIYSIYESLLNFAPANPANEDDNLELSVTYTVLGSEQSAPVDAPVHFVPSIGHLLIAVLIGSMLGSASPGSSSPTSLPFQSERYLSLSERLSS